MELFVECKKKAKYSPSGRPSCGRWADTFPVRLDVEDFEGATDAVEEVVDVACISRFVCCKVCSASWACGDSCISSGFSCSKGIGCACAGEEVC